MAWIRRNLTSMAMMFIAVMVINVEWGALTANAPLDFALSSISVGLLVLAWLVARRRMALTWYRTALDWAGVLWLIALCGSTLSMLINVEGVTGFAGTRVGLLASWYWLLYALVWIVTTDLLSNGILKRRHIAHALLAGAALPMLAGLLQALASLLSPGRESGLFGLARVGGTMRNPSMFGTLLFVVLGVALALAISASRRRGRVLYGGLALLAGGLLTLTFSRGAWLGGVATVGALLVMSVLRAGGLTRWWGGLTGGRRLFIQGAALLAVIVLAVGGVLLLESLSLSGRGIDSRTYIWSAALDAFAEQPLFGHGPKSFSEQLMLRISLPPTNNHNHAHNLMLHALAELGLVGGIALAVSVALILRWGWRALNSPALSDRERPLVRAGLAVALGFALQSLVDVTGFQLSVALVLLWVLAMLTTPAQPVRRSRMGGWAAALTTLTCVALLIGVQAWSAPVNADYVATLGRMLEEDITLPDAATRLESVVARDPYMPSYRWTLAMVYAEQAHSSGDLLARGRAIELLRGLPELGAGNAMAWANLGELLLEAGEFEAGADAFERALARASESEALTAALGIRAEQAGQTALARVMFAHLLTLPEAASWALSPGIRDSAVFASLPQPDIAEGSRAHLVQMLLNGDAAGALAHGLVDTPRRADNYAILAMAAHEIGDPRAGELLERAAELTVEPVGAQWLALARFRINGVALPAAENPMKTENPLWDTDFRDGVAYWYSSYYRQVPWRMFVPALGYSERDPLLVALGG
jgi:putative inorganic carbon (HCO3(-)) transporter